MQLDVGSEPTFILTQVTYTHDPAQFILLKNSKVMFVLARFTWSLHYSGNVKNCW